VTEQNQKSVGVGGTLAPLIIYDSDCHFCLFWIRYWQKLTGPAVSYAPYQKVASQFPEIPLAEFKRAVKYIAPDGTIASGAEAVFLALSHVRGHGVWLLLYRHLPGFAELTEDAYALIASNRGPAYRLSLSLWGRDYEPPRYELVSWLFLRLIGLVYLAAFLSFGAQAMGLIGSNGIEPLAEFIDAATALGAIRYRVLPMVFWISHSDFAIKAVCWAGATLALLIVFNVVPRLSLFLAYALYLSLFYAGQIFMGYQWDTLLLESGALALVLSFATRPGIWLLRWFLFRFMLESGAAKWLSGDSTWHSLSALSYYFQSEPLPTPLAWYAHHLPQIVLTGFTAATLFIEISLPILIFFPRRMRFIAGFAFLLLQTAILLTGNYCFFNLLTMVLCVPLFDDAVLGKIIPSRASQFVHHVSHEIRPGRIASVLIGSFVLLVVTIGLIQLQIMFFSRISTVGAWLNDQVAPFSIVNTYGLFAVMSTTRPEIIVEGSDDGERWTEYTFKYKPGKVMTPPRWNIPLQPRLDWQMWFAALGPASESPWFSNFLHRLLQNSPPVLALMCSNPFPNKPPHYVRAVLYDYRFSTPEVKKTTGAWWTRQPQEIYYPPVSLAP
jgi:predicted DCC family thiol-disulfide oxidoreductase YuxK